MPPGTKTVLMIALISRETSVLFYFSVLHLLFMMFCIRARTSFWLLLTGEVTKITPSDGRQFCGYFIHSLPRLKWILCWISTLSSSQFHQSKCLHILVLSFVFFLESSCTYSGPQQWVHEWESRDHSERKMSVVVCVLLPVRKTIVGDFCSIIHILPGSR